MSLNLLLKCNNTKMSDGQLIASGPVVVSETETKELYSNERIGFSGVDQLHEVSSDEGMSKKQSTEGK